MAAISWRTILASSPSRPPPPYSFGQCGTVQPLSRMRSNQTRCASEENLVLRPPQKVSPSEVMGLRISGGQFCSSHARVSARNFSRSAMRRFHCKDRCADHSGGAADFNMSMQAPPVSRGGTIGYTGLAPTIEKQEETRDAAEATFAWRNERRAKTNL